MKKILLVTLSLTALMMQSSLLFAHAEHDKARYVAVNGVDKGRCDKPDSPCKTIRYAAQHANKGDNIRVAAGNYSVDDTDTLFYLLSQILPIRGNYSTFDYFNKADKKRITRLIGVPLEYAQQLSNKGFTVIVDTKGVDKQPADARQFDGQQINRLRGKLDIYSNLQKAQSELNCTGGLAGDHPCNNIDLLAHVPLSSFSSNPSGANDIWGHFDLNDRKEYALIGLSNGIGIVEVTDPVNPRVVGTVASQQTIWRDLKVYQFFDHSEQRWKNYAYVTADNASVGLMIIDLTGLPQSASVASTDATDLSAHNVYLSNVDYSTGVALTGRTPYLHIAGSNQNGGAFNSYGLSNPTDLTSIYKPRDAVRSDYSHDVSSMVITDTRKDTQCVNGTDHCEIFFDFNENNFQLWDKTNNTNPSRLSTTSYANVNYVHSGWYTEDKLVVIVHDELDEQNAGLNTTVRFFDMNNLTAPIHIGTWTGPTRAIDHNGFVRGNRYYMSNYERGMTVLDITDPTIPSEVGYFDTYPINDSASFNGAWGVYPFLPSGTLLVSDINSGLYILRDRTLTSNRGSFSFDQSNYDVNEGDSITISINRNNGSQGNVTVAWELTVGAAGENDFVINSGELEWLDGETQVKTISVPVNNDQVGEPAEVFFVRLFDPQNGATLVQPNLATITIAASNGNNIPTVSAGEDIVADVGDSITLTATSSDLDSGALAHLWEQISGESVTLSNANTLSASFIPTIAGSYSFSFTATDPQNNSASDVVNVTVNGVNSAPVVSAGEDVEVNFGQTVTLGASASDIDGDTLSFLWVQTAGSSVSLSSTDSLQTSFTPSSAGSLSFQFSATDGNGGVSSATVNVTVNSVAGNQPPIEQSSSGGGSIGFLLIIIAILGFLKPGFIRKSESY